MPPPQNLWLAGADIQLGKIADSSQVAQPRIVEKIEHRSVGYMVAVIDIADTYLISGGKIEIIHGYGAFVKNEKEK